MDCVIVIFYFYFWPYLHELSVVNEVKFAVYDIFKCQTLLAHCV